jgi:hypothetical protein
MGGLGWPGKWPFHSFASQADEARLRIWLSGHRLFLRYTKPPAMMAAKRNMPPEITKNSSLTLMPAKVEIIL